MDHGNSSSDLQYVLAKYQSNSELLKLILTSKVEEDRRRTEEAKLKAKELDLYFKYMNNPPMIQAENIHQSPMRTGDFTKKISRRRKSMQALTKQVETSEFPYDDQYFWKNNGNTVQKKTGLKSVYYKCANSLKGCPVNKTVIEQPNGRYVIKYRGEHIANCAKVEKK